MRSFVFFLLLIFSLLASSTFAQCKTFRLNAQGDTLDCIDNNNKKQGKWVIKVESVRAEPGYEEEGEFKDDRKEGPWRRYNLTGDFVAVENYKWGNKDGVSQYFTIAGLEHEETWRAINPDNPFDTVYVPNVNDPEKYEMKIVKIEASSVKNGNWRYYNPETGSIMRTEFYLFDKLQEQSASQSGGAATKVKAPKNDMPKEVQQFEKKIAKKKKITIRDGSVQY